jgi:hypothetical protein
MHVQGTHEDDAQAVSGSALPGRLGRILHWVIVAAALAVIVMAAR